MYKISLYPEFHLKKQRAKLSLLRTTLLITLLGLELSLVGSLIMSAALLREQASNLEHVVASLTTYAQEVGQADAALDVAQAMLTIRGTRIDWSPKLAALGEKVGSDLLLEQVTGNIAGDRRPAQFELTGGAQGNAAQLEDVSAFIEALRSDSRVVVDFPKIKLGTLKGEGEGNFHLTCEPAEGDS